jgi:16S rRNA (cytidine1402-2'-O)-methyltransferase
VTPIPGPSAMVAAVVASGLPTDSFQFFGFVPPKKTGRRKFLEQLRESSCTSVLFESPHRIVESLEDVKDVLGDRPVVLAREVTKIHEEFLRGKCSSVIEELKKRGSVPGEITLLIAAAGEEQNHIVHAQPLKSRVEELMHDDKLTRMDALKTVARERHMSKRQAYREFEGSEQ